MIQISKVRDIVFLMDKKFKLHCKIVGNKIETKAEAEAEIFKVKIKSFQINVYQTKIK